MTRLHITPLGKTQKKGRATKLPVIEESHKEILFLEWEAQLIKAERETSRARAVKNNIIKLINDNFHSANLIFECSPKNILKEKALEKQWKQDSNTREEKLKKFKSLNRDTRWIYLVKPHSQKMTAKCLADVADRMMPELLDVVTQVNCMLGVNTQVVPYDSQGNTAGVTTNQSLDHSF